MLTSSDVEPCVLGVLLDELRQVLVQALAEDVLDPPVAQPRMHLADQAVALAARAIGPAAIDTGACATLAYGRTPA